MTAKRQVEVRGKGTEQKGKRTHGHGQQCGDLGEGMEEGIRGLSGNGKNTIKIKIMDLFMVFFSQRTHLPTMK